MAYEIPNFYCGVLAANQDLSAESTYQFTPVRVVASSGLGVSGLAAVAPVAATGDPILGILQNNPQLAEAATVMVEGISKVLAKGTLAVGDPIMAAPAGGVLKATSAKYVIGYALEPASAGDITTMLLKSNGLLA